MNKTLQRTTFPFFTLCKRRLVILSTIFFLIGVIRLQAQFTVTFEVEEPACGGFLSGSATAIVTGGQAPFEFAWNTGATTQTISGIGAGTYTVTVTDASSFTVIKSVSITEPDPVIVTTEVANCSTPAQVTVSASGGSEPFLFFWSDGNEGSEQIFNPGIYCVTVLDANLCGVMTCVTITDEAPQLWVQTTPVSCPGANDGTASAIISDGIPPYTYVWNTGATTSTIDGLSEGIYSVTATDANGCYASANGLVSGSDAINLFAYGNGPSCAESTNGSATASTTGGLPPYSYSWSTGQSGYVIGGLGAGIYSVTVTDVNGCTESTSVTLIPKSNISISITTTDESCFGAGDGIATAYPSGGVAPYDYVWSNGATGSSVINLSSGTYSLTVTDALGCERVGTATINGISLLTIDVEKEDVDCYGENSGSILVSGWGGSPPYTVLWDNGQTVPELTNLFAGNYTVTVTDAGGCSAVETITVNQQNPLNINISSTDVGCEGANSGTATAYVSGGTPPYLYLWSNGQNSPTVSSLSTGTYTLSVTDANGCTAVQSTFIDGDEFILDIAKQDVFCNGDNTGSVLVSGWGGTPLYTYAWSTGFTETETSPNAGSEITDLSAGIYTVTVTDATGCIIVQDIEITEPLPLQVNISTSDVDCAGGNGGSASAFVSGGTSPYTYQWSNGQQGQYITGLAAGIYTLTVQDANYCTLVKSFIIKESGTIEVVVNVVGVDCAEASTGSATAYAFGGVAPYSFQWSAGQSGQTATGLSAGTYQLTVSDANGCTLLQQVDIPFENDFIIDVATQDVVCHGESTGSILVSGWGGTPLYTYEWSNGTVETETSPNAGSEIFNLNAGTYYVTVSDAAGCTIVESVEIIEPPELLVNVNTTQTGCQGENTGTATADISGGTPPYTYTWSNGSTTPSVTDLEAGEYWLMIMDANYCTLVKSFEITESEGLTIEINSTNVLCGETNTGVATANVIGGTPPYTYAWNTGASTQTISDLPPGTYTVVVSDANGCGDFEMVTITEVGDVAIQINADQISCFGTNDGVVSALVSGGTPPYDYLWNTGAVSSTLTNLESGAYSVTVTDVNNCSSSAMATLLQPASVNISLSGTSVSCYGYSDGSASVSVSGGTPPYNYLWSSGQTTPLITGLTAGVYEIIITDNSGCISSANFTILQPQELIITTDVTNAACGNAGAISAIVTGGTPPYQYEWSNGQTASTADNLSADTYSLTVSDANGCVVAASATVLSSDDLSCVVNVVSEISTSNGLDGTVSADALGGTTPYSYLWSNGQSAQTISDLPEGTYTVTITDTEGCTTSCSVTLTAPEDCENLTDPGEIGVDQYLCGPGGDPDPIVNIEFPSGGSGNIQYMWMTYNEPVPFSPNIWQAIPDETGPSYDPGPVFETTYFIRCARREGCPNFIETEAVTVEVGEEVVATIIEPDLICEDELVQFSAVDVGEGAIYNWDFGLAGNPQTATGSSVEVAFSSFGPFDITLWVTQDGCTSMDINRIYVTDNPADCGNVTFLLDVDVLSPHEVELEWSLPTSQNNYQFIVERSPDREEFQPIAAINDWTEYENGELYLYRYVDEKPKRGKSFYRIKTVVESGARIFYSNVEEAMIYPGSNLLFIYPNPVDNELFIEVVDSYNTSIEVDITDVQGRVLETISLPNGTLRKAIDFTDYSRGIYFLRAFYDGKDMKVIKAVKM